MKRNLMVVALALGLASLLAPPSWAQMSNMGIVKGVVKDREGKPIPNAQVQFVGTENGRRLQLKTDKKGEYYSLGVQSGKYNVNFSGPDGTKLFSLSGVQVKLGEENKFDLDMQKEFANAQATGQAQMTPEQKKQIEESQKENSKIKGLNEKLAAAAAAQTAGNYEQAASTLTEAAQMDPTRDLIWFKLADSERLWASKTSGDPPSQKERYAKSIEDYKKAIAIKPQGAYYNNMAEAYAKTGDTQSAIAAYSQAAQLDPTEAGKYYFNEGAVLTNTGKVDEAIAAFDKAIAADPTKPDAYYWKGVNLMAKATIKGDKMEAPVGTAEAFNKYIELAPTGPYADPAKQMLDTMGAKIETGFGKPRSTPKKK
ncbi:MAG TPA: tetratricopeptide repeat protein [Terriglobales bacterium]